MRKKAFLGIMMGVIMAFGCVGCKSNSSNGKDSGSSQVEQQLPEVIASLRAEGQYQAPTYVHLPQYDPVNLEDDRIKAIAFESVAYNGKPTNVFAYFGMPETASAENKVPAVVLVHGGGGTAFPEWVQLWVDAGYAAIAIDTEGRVNVGGISAWNPQSTTVSEVYGGPTNDSLSTSFRDINKQWIYFAISAAMKANSFIRRDTRVDENRVGITGISWGGMITSMTMCADDRFAFAVPVYCNGNFNEGNMETLMNTNYAEQKTRELWEPSNYFDLVKAKVMLLNADHDFSHAMVGTNASHTQLKESYQVIIPDLVHGHIQGWEVKETIAFADSVVGKGTQKLVRVTSQTVANGQVTVKFSTSEGVRIASAEMYAIEGAYEMGTETASAYVCGLKEDFKKVGEASVTAQGEVTLTIPENVSHFYVNLVSDEGFISSANMIKI